RLLDLFLGHVAHDLFLYLATFEYQEGRDTPDAVAHRCGAVTVNVHLADLYLALVLIGKLIHDRGNRAAWAAPGCPEIHQHWLVCLQYVLIKICISYFENTVVCHLSSIRVAPGLHP